MTFTFTPFRSLPLLLLVLLLLTSFIQAAPITLFLTAPPTEYGIVTGTTAAPSPVPFWGLSVDPSVTYNGSPQIIPLVDGHQPGTNNLFSFGTRVSAYALYKSLGGVVSVPEASFSVVDGPSQLFATSLLWTVYRPTTTSIALGSLNTTQALSDLNAAWGGLSTAQWLALFSSDPYFAQLYTSLDVLKPQSPGGPGPIPAGADEYSRIFYTLAAPPNQVPEPATTTLMVVGGGVVGLVCLRRRTLLIAA